jgi:hypothetical protein
MVEAKEQVKYGFPLIKFNEGFSVPISHVELDTLVGRLMQVCDLTGDMEQRRALKSELKHRCRSWLNDIYQEAGYDDHQGATDAARIVLAD